MRTAARAVTVVVVMGALVTVLTLGSLLLITAIVGGLLW